MSLPSGAASSRVKGRRWNVTWLFAATVWLMTLYVAFRAGRLGGLPFSDAGATLPRGRTGLTPAPITTHPGSSRLGYLPGGYPVTVKDIALVINVGPNEDQWRHNYKRIFSLWGSEVPFVYWCSNFSSGVPPQKPHVIQVPAETVHPRYALMLGAAFAVAPRAVQWFITLDEDSYVFVENLLDVLGHYDSRLPWYVGDVSEDQQGLDWYTRMAYGGGGSVFSRPVVEALMGDHDYNLKTCVQRWDRIATGDERLARCVADLGVRFTRHGGFHQVDLKGDIRHVLQYFYSQNPLVSLHHMYVPEPIFKSEQGPLNAMDRLFASYRAHGRFHSVFLALHVAHDLVRKWTVTLNVGYSIRVWGEPVPSHLFTKLVPEYDFSPWQPRLGAGYSFDVTSVPPEFVCNCAYFEWHGRADDRADGAMIHTYKPQQNHRMCNAEYIPSALAAVKLVKVVTVPCSSQREAVKVMTVTPTFLVLHALDCRRDVIDIYPENF